MYQDLKMEVTDLSEKQKHSHDFAGWVILNTKGSISKINYWTSVWGITHSTCMRAQVVLHVMKLY